MLRRGCGTRVPGGVYLVTDVCDNRWATPIDSFLFDPPWIPKDKAKQPYYPKAIGTQIIENPNSPSVMDVWDWIGEEHYPYFPDFWEETRRFGLSRRITQGANFDLLTQQSQLIGFHHKGVLFGTKHLMEELKNDWVNGVSMNKCPHNKTIDHYCISTAWQLVDEQENDDLRLHDIAMPRDNVQKTFKYKAATTPYWASEPEYQAFWQPAAMFHLPIHRIEVIEDKLEGRHELPMELLQKSITDLPIVLKEE